MNVCANVDLGVDVYVVGDGDMAVDGNIGGDVHLYVDAVDVDADIDKKKKKTGAVV